MLRLFRLIFTTDQEWERMAARPPHPVAVFLLSLLPLLAAALAVEAWGLMRFGEAHGELGQIRLPAERVIKYVIFYGAGSFLMILAGAGLLRNVAPSFNLQYTFGACFTLIGYGYAPILLTRALDGLPQVNTWVCWGIGAMLALRVLYHGVAHWLKPEQTKGLGVFVVSVIGVVVLYGV